MADEKLQDTQEFKDAVEAAVSEAQKEWEQSEAGLRANRDEALKEKKKLAAAIKRWQDLGLDPEEVAALKEQADKQAADEAKAANDWEAREKQLKEQHAKVVKDLEARAEGLYGALDKEVRRSKAVAAIAKHAPDSVDLLLPHVLDAVQMVETEGQFTAIVKGDNGSPKYMPDPKNKSETVPMTIEAYVATMRERFPNAFPGTGGAGTGGESNTRTGTGGVKAIAGGADDFNAQFLANLKDIAAGKVQVETLYQD